MLFDCLKPCNFQVQMPYLMRQDADVQGATQAQGVLARLTSRHQQARPELAPQRQSFLSSSQADFRCETDCRCSFGLSVAVSVNPLPLYGGHCLHEELCKRSLPRSASTQQSCTLIAGRTPRHHPLRALWRQLQCLFPSSCAAVKSQGLLP